MRRLAVVFTVLSLFCGMTIHRVSAQSGVVIISSDRYSQSRMVYNYDTDTIYQDLFILSSNLNDVDFTPVVTGQYRFTVGYSGPCLVSGSWPTGMPGISFFMQYYPSSTIQFYAGSTYHLHCGGITGQQYGPAKFTPLNPPAPKPPTVQQQPTGPQSITVAPTQYCQYLKQQYDQFAGWMPQLQRIVLGQLQRFGCLR